MKLLTFLGAARAYETTYVMADGREHTAPFCGVALARFFPDANMRVFVTQKARDMHYPSFKTLVEDFVESLERVDISDGSDEAELWQVFEAVVANVDENEAVVFDITHGFRSLPFLSFLAAAYLRVVKDIRLQAVLYGNFEARDTSVTPNRAPVIDMTRFVDLLDWMVAADRFVRFGDAHDLAERLRSAKPGYQAQQRSTDVQDQARRLGQAASALDDVSLALRLIRPAEAMAASDQLQLRLPDAAAAIQMHARPFLPLSQQVADAYAPLAMSQPTQTREPEAALMRERRMVQWYLDRKQYVQAMAVAREWIISWAMLHADMSEPLDRNKREEMERAFNQANQERRQRSGSFDDFVFQNGARLRAIPQIAQALKLFHQVGDTRNDLLHAGKRPNPLPADRMEHKIKWICAELEQLQLPG